MSSQRRAAIVSPPTPPPTQSVTGPLHDLHGQWLPSSPTSGLVGPPGALLLVTKTTSSSLHPLLGSSSLTSYTPSQRRRRRRCHGRCRPRHPRGRAHSPPPPLRSAGSALRQSACLPSRLPPPAVVLARHRSPLCRWRPPGARLPPPPLPAAAAALFACSSRLPPPSAAPRCTPKKREKIKEKRKEKKKDANPHFYSSYLHVGRIAD